MEKWKGPQSANAPLQRHYMGSVQASCRRAAYAWINDLMSPDDASAKHSHLVHRKFHKDGRRRIFEEAETRFRADFDVVDHVSRPTPTNLDTV